MKGEYRMLFSWHDVETILESEYDKWPAGWNRVSVYSDSVEIFYLDKSFDKKSSEEYLRNTFKKNYLPDSEEILVELTGGRLKIYYEEIEEDECVSRDEIKRAPLFKESELYNGKLTPAMEKLPGDVKILAFHSYKGGVGRTLSLVGLLRECSQMYPDKRFLVIDSDIEAPGLTWMNENSNVTAPISYLDLLDVIHYETIDDNVLDKLADMMSETMIRIETDEVYKEHFFLPVYRDIRQVMELTSNPGTILYGNDNKFVITEIIAKLAEKLKVDMVFADLRAGVTELSAPFLFDSRVEKYYVTSTSMQSIYGIRTILNAVYAKTDADFPYSKILLTMIPREMKKVEIEDIEDELLLSTERMLENGKGDENTLLRTDYVKEFLFEDRFIHIGGLDELCMKLKDSELSKSMKTIAEELYVSDDNSVSEFDENTIRDILKNINDIAKIEVTAEGAVSSNMLITSSIKEIARSFSIRVPRVVVMGAKGAGKTFMYKQFLAAKTWGKFLSKTGDANVGYMQENTLILPLAESENSNLYPQMRKECIMNAADELDIKIGTRYVRENYSRITEFLEKTEADKISEWIKKWKEAILAPFNGKYNSLDDLDEELELKRKKIVYVVDGLEDMSSQAQLRGQTNWKTMIKTLCQDVINELGELHFGNIGIIVLVRRDYTTEAITINYEQFRGQYQKYELNWTQTEALRLVLWLVNRADSRLSDGVDILNATKPVIVDKLKKLWGNKLGKENSKEAFSDRWVLAALSGFDGQLQARDIVRFLKYSTDDYQEVKIAYPDRIIMPVSIRTAIKPCSRDKMDDIKTEMKGIYYILDKFDKMNPKTLPLTLDKLELTGEEIAKLEEQGFIKIVDKKYYLPEIIRLGLGFVYEAGARPKVLSLLVN